MQSLNLNIGNLNCHCCIGNDRNDRVAYILYPVSDMLGDWMKHASENHNVTIVTVTGMDWQNVFSPWPAKGVPEGSPDFKGESPEFLKLLCNHVVPEIESAMGIDGTPQRTLIGVSMSGLFALWQWMECDMFANIASLSGSFWYDGFMEWIFSRNIPPKTGTAFFLLGNREDKSPVKTFNSVAVNTSAIVDLLRSNGLNVTYEIVPGNHYSNPIPRLDAAFTRLYPLPHS